MDTLFLHIHWSNLLVIPGLLIGYTVHELGHALTAYFLGDYSQVERGKITLNPLEHISWLGSLCFILFGVGWSKPVGVNTHHFKRKDLDMFFVAISGPIASLTLGLLGVALTLAAAATLIYTSGASTDQVLPLFFPALFPFLFPITSELPQTLSVQTWAITFTGYIAATSLWLTLTSLLPLPGLDGFTALTNLVTFFRTKKREQKRLQPPAMPINTPITLASQQQRRNSTATIHFNIGTEYHQANKFEDAIARYRQAIGSDKYFGPAYINMGLAYLGKGDRYKAIQAFRGAAQYGDQRSQTEAWHQLHQLSQVTPINQQIARENMSELGASPWTDTQLRPNWIGLGVSLFLFLAGAVFLYSYLLTNLLEFLKT